MDRKYKFNWNLIGDLTVGRPNLGPTARVEAYRMMQFAFRDQLESILGTEKTDEIFYAAGKLAGSEFYDNTCAGVFTFSALFKKLQTLLRDLGMCIIRVEEASEKEGKFILTMSEDLSCSGLPELDHEICIFDEGFIAGILEKFTRKSFRVKEVDCWCTGDRTCRFEAEVVDCATAYV